MQCLRGSRRRGESLQPVRFASFLGSVRVRIFLAPWNGSDVRRTGLTIICNCSGRLVIQFFLNLHKSTDFAHSIVRTAIDPMWEQGSFQLARKRVLRRPEQLRSFARSGIGPIPMFKGFNDFGVHLMAPIRAGSRGAVRVWGISKSLISPSNRSSIGFPH